MNLESIDTSFWLTKDKTWMEKRKTKWPAIEKSLKDLRNMVEVNVIKRYFLRGKMPNWGKYKSQELPFRHLDLGLYLWLHPSNDPKVLKLLYENYMESDLVHPRDLLLGYAMFFKHELLMASVPYKSLKEYPFPYMGPKNIIIFRILLEDVNYAKTKINSLSNGKDNFDKTVENVFEWMGYDHFLNMRGWLLQTPKSPLCLHSLYQYDDVLEWCLTTLTTTRDNEFLEGVIKPVYLEAYQKALYCLYHFDTEKEGETPRTRFIHKIHKILDEREFLPEFKQMWLDTKAGKTEVKKPWKY